MEDLRWAGFPCFRTKIRSPWEQLARDEARLDGLAESGVVGNEEVDPRKPERLAQRLHLIGVDLDPGAEGRLEQARVGGRDTVPPERVKEGRELAGSVEAAGREILPALLLQNPAVELVIPEHVERLALRVIVRAGEADQRGLAGQRGVDHLLDQPPPGANLHEVSGRGWMLRQGEGVGGFRH